MADRLWAPWRMEFVSSDTPREEGCLFCRVQSEDRDAENLVAARTPESLLMLNRFPYNSGHLMAVPNRHIADLAALPPGETSDLMGLVQRAIRALERAYNPQGFNVGLNLGHAAGAGIADHLHVHIVPRWVGDTNFMHAIGQTRVLPESLVETYQRVRAAIAEEGGATNDPA